MKTVIRKWFLTLLAVTITVCMFPASSSAAEIRTCHPARGIYNIMAAVGSNMCLDNSCAGCANGTNVQIWSCTDELQQQYEIQQVSGDYYRIVDQNSKKVLDVAGGSRESGTNVNLFEYNGSDAQLWMFQDAGNGYYFIKNKLGCYLDVFCAGTSCGTNVQVHALNKSNAQRFKLQATVPYTKITSGKYTILSALDTNKAVDVEGGGTGNGTNIQLYDSNGTNAQIFNIQSYCQGYYKIVSIDSGKVLDVEGGQKKSGVNVQLYDCNNSDAQLWRFYDAGNGFFYIKNKLGYYLDVDGGFTNNCTNIWVYSGNKTTAQKFKLVVPSTKSSELRFPIRGSIAKSSTCKTNGQYCDYVAASGTPVYAPCDGTVQFRQSFATSYSKLCSYGNSIYFTSSDGKTTVLCAHLSSFNNVPLTYTQSLAYPCGSSKYTTKTITLGTRTVKQGDLLGYTGQTGNASGPHIHIEVKINGTAMNPASVFKTW